MSATSHYHLRTRHVEGSPEKRKNHDLHTGITNRAKKYLFEPMTSNTEQFPYFFNFTELPDDISNLL